MTQTAVEPVAGAPTPPSASRLAEGCWPTPTQELLLRAALLDGDDALAAWHAWRRDTDLATLDIGSRRLFPVLYRNLSRLGVHDALMPRLKEAFSRTYFENHLLFESAAAVLRAFEKEGIATLVLKGAALLSYYGDSGLRPMLDFDVLVPHERALEAMRILKTLGWRGTYHREPERRIAITHSVPFADRMNRQLDLHWHVLADCWHADDDAGFWKRSVPIELGGVRTRRLDTTDQLLHVCVHGIRWDEPPPIRWVADALAVLRAPTEPIEWDRLASDLEFRHLVLAGAAGLAYMRDHFQAPVPASVIDRLVGAPVTPLDRFVYDIETGPYRRLSTTELLGVLYGDFVRLGSMQHGLSRMRTFVRRTANRWSGTPPWQLVLRLPFRLLRRVARRVAGRRFTDVRPRATTPRGEASH